MNAKEELVNINTLNIADLEAHLLVLYKEQFELRMQNKGGQLTNTSKLKKVSKSIARAKTIITQKKY